MNPQVADDDANNDRSFATILSDTKEELKQFVGTRIAMLKTETGEKLKILKVAGPLAIAGLLLLLTAFLLFTVALVGLVFAFLPDNSYRLCLAFLAVAVLWSILGGIAAYFAKREFETKELLPNKTIGVLKDDGLWIQSEVKKPL
ncbi:MAG: phage holin family protein [Acidobacteriaceae bacterium]|nr:phage holin family protein [Acidobacteriaceae bacterium]